MQFCFHPRLESGCSHVSHCPHLGGAALGTVVLQANTSGDTIDRLHRLIDVERERNAKLVEEVERLARGLAETKLIGNVYRVVCCRHEAACCDDCGKWVEQAGKDEILRSRIGPHLRSRAVWLRNMIGISYRKVPQIIGELYGVTLTPAALIGFETMLADKAWLREELARLQTCDLSQEKAMTLQARLLRHSSEWLVFLDDERVSPTNNLAERALRPLVVLRKITFGSRSDAAATRMAKLMTVGETARRRGHRASDIYLHLYTRPPDHVLRRMYAAA